MAPEGSPKGASKSLKSQQTGPSSQTPVTQDNIKTVRSSAYDANFEQHYIDNGVYPVRYDYGDVSPYPEPSNLSEIRAAMAAPREPLSPSPLTDKQFRDFTMTNDTPSEGTIMRTIVPKIAGNTRIPNEGHIPFTNLVSMTKECTVKPVPDFWDGARPGDLHEAIRDLKDLSKKIIPTKHTTAPVVPNFFLEAKAPSGGIDVARRQAMADGAYGASGIHSLQNHGLDEPVYDGNAYTYSSTYQRGHLLLYGHHLSAPTTSGGEPRYHMTQLGAYDLTNSRDSYREATAALRNTRDLAKRQRDQIIQAANARVMHAPEVQPRQSPTTQGTDHSGFACLLTQEGEQGGDPASVV